MINPMNQPVPAPGSATGRTTWAKPAVRRVVLLVPGSIRSRVHLGLLSLYRSLRSQPTPPVVAVGWPLEVQYRTVSRNNYLCDLPVSLLQHTDLVMTWVETLRIHNDRGAQAARHHLAEWFSATAPTTVADVMDLAATTPYLAGDPATATFPWSDRSPWQVREDRRGCMTTEAGENGVASWDLADGWRSFGPASDRLLDLELGRLTRTYDSISRNGFDQSHGTLLGRVFQRDDDIVVMPFHGWHRIAALLTLGADTLPMRFSRQEPVVRRSDAAWWPNVVNGLFTVDQARHVFDRHFLVMSLDAECYRDLGPIHTY